MQFFCTRCFVSNWVKAEIRVVSQLFFEFPRAGYKVKFVDEANREPGDIIVGGRDGINGEFEAHIGVYIGNELYISQSPKSQYDQLVGQAPGMKIRDVSTLPYPDIKYREIQK